MTKAEILRRQKEKDKKEAQEKYDDFIIFMEKEGFIETIDKVGNYAQKMPMFYKMMSEEIYLVFNIPTFGNIKKYGFHADFWKVFVKSRNELLEDIIIEKNKVFILPSFDMERDLEVYRNELSKLK